MSDYIDTREGWREVSARDATADQRTLIITDTHLVERPDVKRYFVRVPPVPPLPTAPYTVIRAQVGPDDPNVTLVFDGSTWLDIESGITARRLDRITGFEVLSEPRAVTAKAVIQRVRDEGILRNVEAHDVADEIAREFGPF